MNNITISHVIAAITLKLQNIEEKSKQRLTDLRNKTLSFNSDFGNFVRDELKLDAEAATYSNEFAKLFNYRKSDVSANVSFNNSYGLDCMPIPSDLIDYLTGKFNEKAKKVHLFLQGYLTVKNTGISFSFNKRAALDNSAKLRSIIKEWDNCIQDLAKERETLKRLSKFKENINNEAQIVLLELQSPEAARQLNEKINSFIGDRLEIDTAKLFQKNV